MPRLAIVISAVGNVEALEATLVSVLENRPADCEVLVALTRRYADPYDLKDEVKFLQPTRRTSAVAALNAAIARTASPIVHTLSAGCLVTEGWTNRAQAHFSDTRVASVAAWACSAGDPTKLVAAGIGYHRRGQRHLIGEGQQADMKSPATVIGPAAFAAFYRKAALEFLGGFSSQLTLRQADADVALALRRAGLLTVVEPAARVLAPENIDAGGGTFAEARAEERLFWRTMENAGLGALISHGALAAWDCLRALPKPSAALRMLGRSWAALELGSHARHRRRLAELAAHAQNAMPATPGNLRIDASHRAPTRTEATQSTRMRTG